MTVTFLNQPKLSEHTIDEDQNIRRLTLVQKIETFLSFHKLFKDKTVSVTFFHTGASGLTSLVDTVTDKFVLKILLRPDGPQGEVQFLKAWESVGVSVPHIYESGMLEEHPYILMQYISVQTLEYYSEKELLEKQVFKKMGEVLYTIHKTLARGYGRMKENGVGMYEEFEKWLLEYPQTVNQLSYIQKHSLLPTETFGSIEKAKEILIEYCMANSQSTYCHWDFAPGNIFDTEPLTVFDPVPMFNHPYLDIARSIVQTIGVGYADSEVSKQFIESYFSLDQQHCNRKVLQAAVLFISHTKIPHWHQTNEEKIIKNVQNYLIKNKYLLES